MVKVCWICGGNADSEEHKFKSSDIRKHYGKRFQEKILFIRGDDEYEVSSFKDKILKYEKTICRKCNNELTQPSDKAYDQFVNYISGSFYQVQGTNFIDFEKIYQNVSEEKKNLYKYYAKQAGCRIAETLPNKLILESLADFIKGKSENNSLIIKYIQKEGIKYIKNMLGYDRSFLHLSHGPTSYYKSISNIELYHGWISYDWLTIHWFCGLSLVNDIGNIENTKEYVKYENIDLEGRDKNINIIDWFENYGLRSDKEKVAFVKDTLLNSKF